MPQNRAYSLFHIKAIDAERREITGLATTPDMDRVGDVIEPKGAKFSNPLPLLLFHDHTRPVGSVKLAKPTDEGIEFTAKVPTIEEPGPLRDRVEEAWQSVKLGLVKGVSIGFRVLEDGVELLRNGGLRFKAIEILELSLVSVPANAAATIASIKSIDAAHLPASGPAGAPSRSSSPGVSGQPRARAHPRGVMKSIAEKKQAFVAEKQAKVARLNDLMKDEDEGATLDTEAQQEFDGLTAEIKTIDGHLARLDTLEEVNKAAAVAPNGNGTKDAIQSRGGGTVRVKQPDLPVGIGFARAVKAAVVASIDRRSMLEVAKEMYPSDERLHGHITHVLNLPKIVAQIRAVVPAGTTSQADWASALIDPTNLAGEFIEYLRPATIIGKFGAGNIPSLRRVPFNVRMIEQTQGGTGYWVGQGAPKPLTAFGFSPVTLAFTKVAAISVITEELARFSSPSAEQLTRDGLRDALVERIDRDFIDPAEAGTANIQPQSITNGLTALTSAGTSADNARTDLANLVAAFVEANQNPEGLVLIMPTTLALALSFLVNGLGQPEFPGLNMTGGNINGIPVITSQYAANASGGGNLVIAVNAREIFLADDGQVTIDASRETSLQMADNPTNNSVTGTGASLVSMWQTNSIALRAERFINWDKRRDNAVVYMDDVNWGSIGSPA